VTITDLAGVAYSLYAGAWTTITSRYPVGTNIFEKEWDVLILLDTCRRDALAQVASDYEFINDVESVISVGSSSNEWIANTFKRDYEDEISNTAYITANGHAEKVLFDRIYPEVHINRPRLPPNMAKLDFVEPNSFGYLEQVWKYSSQEHVGHTPPGMVTDRSIRLIREGVADHYIIHYSQPHAPYTSMAFEANRELLGYEKDPFSALRSGTSKEKIWDAYISDLKMVLNMVEILLQNIDARKVAISADHGEAFGEFGLYGHLPGLLHPQVKQVPWAETTAEDTSCYEPVISLDDIGNSANVSPDMDEHLEALGYK